MKASLTDHEQNIPIADQRGKDKKYKPKKKEKITKLFQEIYAVVKNSSIL